MKIINPFFVYLAGVSESLALAFIFVIVAFLILAAVFNIYYLFSVEDLKYNNKTEEAVKKIDKKRKKYTVCFFVSMIIVATVPSKDTIYAMIAFNALTEENIKKVGNTGKDVVDYVFDKIEEISKDREK